MQWVCIILHVFIDLIYDEINKPKKNCLVGVFLIFINLNYQNMWFRLRKISISECSIIVAPGNLNFDNITYDRLRQLMSR